MRVHHPVEFRGSSPRGRGTLATRTTVPPPRRFIPARAGNTRIRLISRDRLAVHPRAGGEHDIVEIANHAEYGSSPRGRGTRPAIPANQSRQRFIPARAGNTAAAAAADTHPVHPRAGGEHGLTLRAIARKTGSSPRGRGTLLYLAGAYPADRFIPARAGNTKVGPRSHEGLSVHPRAGGEHKESQWRVIARFGSSPRGRGTRRYPQ